VTGPGRECRAARSRGESGGRDHEVKGCAGRFGLRGGRWRAGRAGPRGGRWPTGRAGPRGRGVVWSGGRWSAGPALADGGGPAGAYGRIARVRQTTPPELRASGTALFHVKRLPDRAVRPRVARVCWTARPAAVGARRWWVGRPRTSARIRRHSRASHGASDGTSPCSHVLEVKRTVALVGGDEPSDPHPQSKVGPGQRAPGGRTVSRETGPSHERFTARDGPGQLIPVESGEWARSRMAGCDRPESRRRGGAAGRHVVVGNGSQR
jgi:hypothetical protein